MSEQEILTAFRAIAKLAEWQCDKDAEEDNDSPADMTAHVNGLIWKIAITTESRLESDGKN